MTSWTESPEARQAYSHAFAGGEPVGTYKILAAFTQPGTLTFLGPIMTAPFSFAP
jgi:hypothetical protein